MGVYIQDEIEVAVNLGNRWEVRHYGSGGVNMVMVIVSVTERSLYLLNYSAKEGLGLLFKSRARKESVTFVDICGKS